MAGISDGSFVHHYQKILFEASNSEPFSLCSTKRKCLSQLYSSANKTASNDTVCAVLEDELLPYTTLVDKHDEDAVNNYAKPSLALLAHAKSDAQQWSCNLRSGEEYDVFNLLNEESSGSSRKHMKNEGQNYSTFKKFELDNNNQQHINQLNALPPENMHQNVVFQTSNTFQSSYNKKSNVFPPDNSYQKQTFQSHPRGGQCVFRTARDELGIQSMRKFGNSSVPDYNSAEGSNSNNFGQKRSLGTRRGVMNKFLCTSKSEINDFEGRFGGNQRQQDWDNSEQQVDERLKNIDPKMIEIIKNEIMEIGTSITWDDIAGLEFAKATIQEVVVWPLLRPDLFTGLRRPPRGILLFGPPGTGKTLIGKCIASQSHSTFFSISASSLTSKWIGDGEKMVRALFAVARCHQPAVVFIDEIDSLLTQRSDTEHESSRRIKTEFLVQLDGVGTGEEDRILVIGATNRPQELDEAARRRLVKKLYIPLPELQARRQIILHLMSAENHCLSEEEVEEISLLTDGYSGADMKNLCQESSLGPIRSLGFVDIQNIHPDEVRPVTVDDFKSALNRVRATVSPSDLDSYVAWDKMYGSGGAAVN
ncbi:hypothetical protein L9F63_018273 [Diploptera punctata]|uniref:Fidgetin-like protein 1 n=1 Tax=Diploptera punctata TaxID=6984 RepID=A0AAD7ZY33_DIPPU|nr:hypothetical protein L9F63_018273 [Diploptera punctata]